MKVLDLFSGIGGFSLGLERAGMTTVAFCEIDPFCRKVLAKHWPKVPCYDDIRTLTAERLAADGISVDVICGGFPCQDISLAGKGAGLAGERSGLWSEYRRLIEEVGPEWVIIENVAALRSRGLDRVLGEIAALGFDAEWHCIPAAAVGAPHRRDRLWIVAHSSRLQSGRQEQWAIRERTRQSGQPINPMADSASDGREPRRESDAAQEQERRQSDRSGFDADVAYAIGSRLEGRTRIARHLADQLAAVERGREIPVSEGERDNDGRRIECQEGGERAGRFSQWLSEPNVGRVANGVPARVDRLRSLGNAVVPQIPEIIGRAIMEAA